MKSNTDYYDFNTMPVGVFEDIQNTSNYELIRRSKFAPKQDLELIWGEINDEITKTIGCNEIFLSYLRNRIAYMNYMKMVLVDGREDMRIMAKVKLAEVEEYKRMLDKSSSIDENLLILSKNQGYKLDKKRTTVKEFFTLIKINSRDGKSSKE